MKLIKIFLSIMVFAVCAALNAPAQGTRAPKPVFLTLKAEPVARVAAAQSPKSSNFFRPDSLVFYESDFQNRRAPRSRSARLVALPETLQPAIEKSSAVARFKIVYYRQVRFVYV